MAADLERRIAGIAALDQPLRRDLYRHLAKTGTWSTRDDVATALALSRSVAAFHLDKLAEAGVVEVRFERTTGRRGPGAGRPSKLYRVSQEEIGVSLPDRHYDLAGSLLAAAIADATKTGRPVAECLREAANAAGRQLGTDAREAADRSTTRAGRRKAIVDVLERHGYEPELRRGGEVALSNCPFHKLAEEHRELVCGMNLDFLQGLLRGLGDSDQVSARLAPAPGFCCVRISA
jgi:predicted ArsR family transcriptional regulator